MPKKKHKKEKEDSKSKEKSYKITITNPWKITTVLLSVFIIISLVFVLSGNSSERQAVGKTINTLSPQQAGEKAVNFIRSLPNLKGVNVSLLNVNKSQSGIYELSIKLSSSQGEQELVSYATKDGRFLFPSGIDMTQKIETNQPQEQPKNIPKSDKPKVELFVMSYCPFGTQAEKGILPVVKLLGDKIDFNLRFVYYSMHGKKELDENLRQYCIQKDQNNKFTDYLSCFLKDGNYSSCLKEAEIDENKLQTCVKQTDQEFNVTGQYNDKSTWLSGRYPLFDVDKKLNEKYEVRGSPTFVINEEVARSGRDPASYLKTICSGFNNKPDECNQKLSSKSPSPGFGYSTTSESNGGSCS